MHASARVMLVETEASEAQTSVLCLPRVFVCLLGDRAERGCTLDSVSHKYPIFFFIYLIHFNGL